MAKTTDGARRAAGEKWQRRPIRGCLAAAAARAFAVSVDRLINQRMPRPTGASRSLATSKGTGQPTANSAPMVATPSSDLVEPADASGADTERGLNADNPRRFTSSSDKSRLRGHRWRCHRPEKGTSASARLWRQVAQGEVDFR